MIRLCRPASADFWLFMLGAGFACVAQAADPSVAVIPPQPVVIQPAAVMAPPPPVPAATETAVQPVAKDAKAKKVSKQAKPSKAVARQTAAKPAGKSKTTSRKR
jgi:hypothetical protein